MRESSFVSSRRQQLNKRSQDYFHAVSVGLERAKETIYIADWWLSPELFLRRPPYYNQEWRLDYTLKRAAERGVKIYVIVYREVEAALTCNSQHTKKALMGLCPEGTPGYGNIRVMRHPDHNVFENAGDMTFYWAHHEKFIVIDYDLAFIGGLDLCFGRWDHKQHPLADVHPAGVRTEIFPGQDFNNNRIMDFKGVDDWKSNELNKGDYGRMPWHDIAMGLEGPCIYDIAEHFVLRWNFCKRDKYKRDDRYDWLTLTGRTGEDEDLIGVQRPKHPVGDYIHHPLSPLDGKHGDPRPGRMPQHPLGQQEALAADETDEKYHYTRDDVDEHGYRHDQHRHGHGLEKHLHERSRSKLNLHQDESQPNVLPSGLHEHRHSEEQQQENVKMTGNDVKKEGWVTASGGVDAKSRGYVSDVVGKHPEVGRGTIHAQLVRSSADWSSGILTEQSIQNAYCEIIRAAKHYVYIENQFFITATGDKQAPVHNLIGAAIVDACVAAHREGRKFRVIIMLPSIPGFAGDLRSDPAIGTRAIMDYQYKSICRGEESIFGKINAAGADPTKYVFCFNLRSYDRLNKTPGLKDKEAKSGITYQDLQRANEEEIMSEGLETSDAEKAKLETLKNKTKDAKEGGFSGLLNKVKSLGISSKDKEDEEEEKPGDTFETSASAAEKRRQFEDYEGVIGNQSEGKDPKSGSADTIAKGALIDEKPPSQEIYAGRGENGEPIGDSEADEDLRQQEVENFVQEELYIHAKLLIVDDRIGEWTRVYEETEDSADISLQSSAVRATSTIAANWASTTPS
jgi:phospholipase D1/2